MSVVPEIASELPQDLPLWPYGAGVENGISFCTY